MEKRIAVLIPCLNEAQTIFDVVSEFRREMPQAEIYVFDNVSTDQTADFATKAGAKVVSSPHRGKGNVVRHMFDLVDADVYLLADGDGTYPARYAHALIKLVDEGADVAVGARLQRHTDGAFPRFHTLGNRLVAFLDQAPVSSLPYGYFLRISSVFATFCAYGTTHE